METSIRRTAKIVCYCIAISFFSACSYKDHIDYINQKAAAERFYADGKYSESIDAYSKALEYVRKVDDPVLQVMILGDMAKVLEKNGEKARAEDLLKERIEIARNRVLDVETRTHTYYALATFYVVNDQCEKATRAVEELKRDEAGKNSSSKETVELLDDILKLRCTKLDGADRNTAGRKQAEQVVVGKERGMEWFVLIMAGILIVFNKQFADVLISWNKFTVGTDFGVNPWFYRITAILFGIFFVIVAIDKLIE